MSDTQPEEVQESSAHIGPEGFGWRKAEGWGAISVLAGLVMVGAVIGFEPFMLIVGVPIALGVLFLAATKGKAGPIVLGFLGLALLVMNTPFLLPSLQRPYAPTDYIPQTLIVVGMLLIVVSAIPAARQPKGPDIASTTARYVALTALIAILAGTVISLMGARSMSDEEGQPGDLTVVAEDFGFNRNELSANAGKISVLAGNDDPTSHTFTIDELDVDLFLPPGKSRRVSFKANPGDYRWYCVFHDDMTGILHVG